MEEKSAPAETIEREPLSPVEQVRSLIKDVRALAEAEVDYVKARVSYSGGIIRKAGLWALLAIFCLFGAIIALILGLLMIVSIYAGPWIATAAVVSIFALAAWIAALCARKTAKNLRFDEDANG